MSDKSRLKRSRKDAELARNMLNKAKHGKRFYDAFDWGFKFADILLSMEERLRNIEAYLDAAEMHIIRTIVSNATIQITTEQTINSDSHIKAETEQTINSDAFTGQETEQTINSDAEISE